MQQRKGIEKGSDGTMTGMFTKEAKERAKELVRHCKVNGDGKVECDEMTLAIITAEGVEGEIEVGVIPDEFFETHSPQKQGMAASTKRENKSLKMSLDANKIWFKKNIFLQINEKEFEALLQHELTHLILRHEVSNDEDERMCNLLNAEFAGILKQLDRKFFDGTYSYYSDENNKGEDENDRNKPET